MLAIVLVLAVIFAFSTRSQISTTFSRQRSIQQAQLTMEELLRLEIGEQNFIHAYAVTKDPFYRQQYEAAVTDFSAKENQVRSELSSENLSDTIGRMNDYSTAQENWRKDVAVPLLAHPNQSTANIDKRNLFYANYESRVADSIRGDLADRNERLTRDTVGQINNILYFSAAVFLLFGLAAIVINFVRSRTNRELEEERVTTGILQRAFRSVHVDLPNCAVGSGYAAASSHLAVGGDVFDMYRLSDNLALILIADVSGKGVDAAVLTAFIKFTIRGIALRRRDPGAILAEFNTAFTQTVDDSYLFVSMFVGMLDTENMTLRYASAGHDSAFLRRSSGVQQLAVTGPVLGVMEEPFGTQTLVLNEGDIVVLATDGLTEARNRRGELLGERGAMDLIERSSRDPQQLADQLITKVQALEGNLMRDDLAILAIRIGARGASDA
jgi:sigma-B regulation protein RsbU (phosphoserine phosphatase)